MIGNKCKVRRRGKENKKPCIHDSSPVVLSFDNLGVTLTSFSDIKPPNFEEVI